MCGHQNKYLLFFKLFFLVHFPLIPKPLFSHSPYRFLLASHMMHQAQSLQNRPCGVCMACAVPSPLATKSPLDLSDSSDKTKEVAEQKDLIFFSKMSAWRLMHEEKYSKRDTVKSISCCDCQFSGWLEVCNLYLNLSGCSVCGNYFGGRQDKTSPCWLQQKSWQPNVIQENPQAYSGTIACGY